MINALPSEYPFDHAAININAQFKGIRAILDFDCIINFEFSILSHLFLPSSENTEQPLCQLTQVSSWNLRSFAILSPCQDKGSALDSPLILFSLFQYTSLISGCGQLFALFFQLLC